MGLIKNLPKYERPREKAFLFGVEALNNAELIAVLLGTGNRDDDALELAYKILGECGTLRNLSLKSLNELSEIKGIKNAKAVKIKAAIELHKRINKENIMGGEKIRSFHDAALILKNYLPSFEKEYVMLLLVDSSNNIIGINPISIGSSSNVIIAPNIILNKVIKCNAKSYYIAHNHPSNEPRPSNSDIIRTNELKMLSALLGITLVDHLILTENSFYSFEQRTIINYSN